MMMINMKKIILLSLFTLNLFADCVIRPEYKPYEVKEDVVENFRSFCTYFKSTLYSFPLSDNNFNSFKKDVETNLVSGSDETREALQRLANELCYNLKAAIHSISVVPDKEKNQERIVELQKKIQQIQILLSLFHNKFRIHPSDANEIIVLSNVIVRAYQE